MKQIGDSSMVDAYAGRSPSPRPMPRCSQAGGVKMLVGCVSRWRDGLALGIAAVLGLIVTLALSPVLLALAIISWLRKLAG